MNTTATDSYLVTEVMTATPQKLQLMLIDAAIRFAERGRQYWRANNNEQACHCLIRSQEILSEMISSLDYESNSDFVQQVAGVYLFIYRRLMEANVNQDENQLNDALRVLNVERETWRLLCEKYGGKITDEPADFTSTSPSLPPVAPLAPTFDDLPTSGFSLEV